MSMATSAGPGTTKTVGAFAAAVTVATYEVIRSVGAGVFAVTVTVATNATSV